MKYDPAVHHRRSIRLQEYDYAQAGAYFVTICAQDRQCLFGEIEAGGMRLNDAGKMVHRWYSELENKFPDIQCDAFICMPNHMHFVVVNVGADLCVRPENEPGSSENVRTCGVGRMIVGMHGQTQTHGQTHRSAPTGGRASADHIVGEHTGSPLHRVVQWFKTMTTNEYVHGVKQYGWPPFPGKLWQRNYWEHIIRDASELTRIREYIGDNPAQWEMDSLFISPNCPDRTPDRPDKTREARAKYATEEWMV